MIAKAPDHFEPLTDIKDIALSTPMLPPMQYAPKIVKRLCPALQARAANADAASMPHRTRQRPRERSMLARRRPWLTKG